MFRTLFYFGMENTEHLDQIRHSLAHLLAAATKDLWPGTHNAIGPSITNGFYQDFDFGERTISTADLPKIEKRMRKLLTKWGPFDEREVSITEAKELFVANPYKLELIEDFSKDGRTITVNDPGDFLDLCKGGHSGDPKAQLKYFKLTSVAGAYWRGDENKQMLTRIYGVAFETQEELDAHLTMLEEAKKRDHRKLGQELELFSLVEEIGGGLPLFYPKGTILREQIEGLISKLQKGRGYEAIWVPHITKGKLYEISGHLDKYDAMYPAMQIDEKDDYYLKPMNCPHFMMLYKTLPHSYRDLPVRWTSTTTVYRYEKSGELSGLTRVRSITQDDCHVFARKDQIGQEVNEMLDMLQDVYSAFGFTDFWVSISTRDLEDADKYIGDPDVWEQSETQLKELISSRGWEHKVVPGEAAFYGPKLDFMFKDAIGREWQLSTIQLDMNLPERFALDFVNADGEKERPVVLHRAILGSVERFMGILIEHFAGVFPVWLSPVQVRFAAVGEAHKEFAQQLAHELSDLGIRAEADVSDESVGKKIRNAARLKIPYVLVVGDKEVAGEDWQVRVRGEEEQITLSKTDFIARVQEEITQYT